MNSTRQWLQAIGVGVAIGGSLVSAQPPDSTMSREVVSATGCVQRATPAEATAGGQRIDGAFVLRGARIGGTTGRAERPALPATSPGTPASSEGSEATNTAEPGSGAPPVEARASGNEMALAATARRRAPAGCGSRHRPRRARRQARDGDRPAVVLRGDGRRCLDGVGTDADRDEGDPASRRAARRVRSAQDDRRRDSGSGGEVGHGQLEKPVVGRAVHGAESRHLGAGAEGDPARAAGDEPHRQHAGAACDVHRHRGGARHCRAAVADRHADAGGHRARPVAARLERDRDRRS